MKKTNLPLNLVMALTMFIFYILYPVWNVPTAGIFLRFCLLNIFLISGALFYMLPWLRNKYLELPWLGAELRPLIFTGIVLFAGLLHLPFWVLPVETTGDIASHISPAATLMAFLGGHRLWVLVIVLAALVLLVRYFRPLTSWLDRHRLGVLIILFVVLNIYGVVLLKYDLVGRLGKWETIYRYPPIPKLLYVGGFLLTGIQEITPRIIQFLFVIGTGLVLINSLAFTGSLTKAAAGTVLLATLLFPSFFHFSNEGLLECGTVFFFAIMSYYFLRSLREEEYLAHTVVWLSLGLLYKQLLLGAFFIIFLSLAYLKMRRQITFGLIKKYLLYLIIPAIAGLPFMVFGSLLHVPPAPIEIDHISWLDVLTHNLVDLVKTLGPLTSIALFWSCFYCVWKKKPYTWYWLIFFVAYYFMIGASAANGYIRHAQPFYLGLFYFFAVFMADVVAWCGIRSRTYALLLALGMTMLFAYHDLWEFRPFQRKTLSNRYDDIVPYQQLMDFLKMNPHVGIRIYAPLESDASHFYLAKNRLKGQITWDRMMLKGLPYEQTMAHFYQSGANLLFLPYAALTEVENFVPFCDRALQDQRLQVVKFFEYHNNLAILVKKKT